ncbi:hypothetical protein BDQ12DRAFT_703504 [Crucibulum laeve]|uniref:Uncharacterized protein n=1 Tax=Crucibulum laeve TaxID=68775 RepID=A0A5C3MBE6_9AGAR|nr:hypothetical protein BDQ12DRAFT_703504 [Crucibulum laeve]
MTLLGGLFGRKSKSSSRSTHDAGTSSTRNSVSTDRDPPVSPISPSYITPDKSLPSSPNGKSSLHPDSARTHASVYPSSAGSSIPASSSKLRLFGRKKQSNKNADGLPTNASQSSLATTLSTSPNTNFHTAPRPAYASRLSTASGTSSIGDDLPDPRRLRPPPSKSAIFAAYADPNSALSTRSLPAGNPGGTGYAPMQLNESPLPSPPPIPAKRPGLFPWSKSTPSSPQSHLQTDKNDLPSPTLSKSSSKQPSSPIDQLDLSASSSFNLKSFRHVRPPSPTQSQSHSSPTQTQNPNAASTSSLIPPQRPRGASINSEASSQRISVAAFREAQARRSLAGSPVPSFRSPSPLLGGTGVRGSPVPSPISAPGSNGRYNPKRRSTGPVGAGYAYASTSEESPSSGEEDSEGEERGLNRRGTVRKGKGKAQSELGHGSSYTYESPNSTGRYGAGTRSHLGHGTDSNSHSVYGSNFTANPNPNSGRSQSSLGHYGSRPRASASTSALSPSAAAKRASVLANANVGIEHGGIKDDLLANHRRTSRHLRDSSTYSNPAAPVGSTSNSNSISAPPVPSITHSFNSSNNKSNSNANSTSASRPNGTKSNSNSNPTSNSVSAPQPIKRALSSGVKSYTQPLAGGTSSSSESDSEHDDSDDDDTPLATLLPPRRPGSAMSSISTNSRGNLNSNGSRTNLPSATRSQTNLPSSQLSPRGRSNSHLPLSMPPRASTTNSLMGTPGAGKPLIDINELTSKKPVLSSNVKKNEEGFTGSGTLLGGEKRVVESPVSSPTGSYPPALGSGIAMGMGGMGGLTSRVPPTTFISPVSTPSKELGEFITASELNDVIGGGSTSVETSPDPSMGSAKRDVISERLARLAKMKVGSGSVDSTSGASRTSGSGGSTNASSPPMAFTEPRGRNLGLSTSHTSTARTQGSSPSPRPAVTSVSPSSSPSPSPRPVMKHRRNTSDVPSSISSTGTLKPSPPDEDLMRVLGGGIKLIRTGGSDLESEDSEEEEESKTEEEEEEREKEQERQSLFLPPIPIKERSPPPAFSVTSRPQHPKNNASISSVATFTLGSTFARSDGSSTAGSTNGSTVASTTTTRQRSSTLVPSSTSSTSFPSSSSGSSVSISDMKSASSSGNMKPSGSGSTIGPSHGTSRSGPNVNAGIRQRSSTLVPMMPIPSASASNSKIGQPPMPSKPFAMRRDSPASSTGDSSSGRQPLTPRDGSEIGTASRKDQRGGEREKNEWSSGVSGLGANKRHTKRRSVSFGVDTKDEDSAKESPDSSDPEERRRERRRGEARAAIELGNVINGRGPIDDDDDDDDDMPINQTLNARMSNMNPMMMQPSWGGMNVNMNMNPNMNMWQQQQSGPQPMLSPAQFMIPPPPSADPAFLAAHQQAMMYAKQAYQMAVAQQAMAAAADEWERGSTVGGYGGGGSVYGGGSSASVMGSPYGMMNMGMMGMQGMNNGWSTGSVVFPPSSRSMYGGGGGISSSRSEYGGGGGGGNWSSSRTSYGEFNSSPSPNRYSRAAAGRDSGYFPPVPPIPKEKENPSKNAARARTSSQPATPTRGTGGRKAAPPSSWRAGGV